MENKKHTIIGSLLLVAAAVLFYYGQAHSPRVASPAEVRQAVAQATESAAPAGPSTPAIVPNESEAAFSKATSERAGATITHLENSFIRVAFTDFGGSIRDVSLKKYPATRESPSPYVLNDLHTSPILAFVGFPGLDKDTHFHLISSTPTEVVYRAVLDGKIEATRTYTLSPDSGPGTDPYEVRQVTVLRNLSDKSIPPMQVSLAVGTAAPTNLLDNGYLLLTGYWNGSDTTFVRRSQLQASGGFLGLLSAHPAKPFIAGAGPVTWGSVSNQFFASILTPDTPASGFLTHRVKLYPALPDENPGAYGISGEVQFDVPALAPQGTAQIGASLYAGPKEYKRLANADVFKHDEDRVMNFGYFRFFSAILLTLMIWMHGWTANWGVAIILTTLTLKAVFLPLTLSASRSAKRMQKIQPEMKALKEKYKDNPQKQQTATLELFKKHKVNPAGGCIPVLVTIPFFWGFYRMLAGAAELRFAPFLWAHDLSMPDTVYTFTHVPFLHTSLPLNVLPILMGVTIIVQTKLSPQPTVDNNSAWMMKFMPLMFMVFYYNYSCGLALYTTVNGLFTIGQQIVINRMRDPVELAPAGAGATPGTGRPSRNVTPRRK